MIQGRDNLSIYLINHQRWDRLICNMDNSIDPLDSLNNIPIKVDLLSYLDGQTFDVA